MTTYHVWLTGQEEPEVVVADDMMESEGLLYFANRTLAWDAGELVRIFDVNEWTRWAIVHDEAEQT
jgi:hypothetical protein